MNSSQSISAIKAKKEPISPLEFSFELQLTPTFMKGRSPLLQLFAQKDGLLIEPPAIFKSSRIPNSPNVTKIKLTMTDKENSLTFFSNTASDEITSLITKCNLSWAFKCSIHFILLNEESKEKGKSAKGRLRITILAPSQKVYDSLKFNFSWFDS